MPSFKPTFGQRLKLDLFSKYVKAQAELHELSYLFWECTLRCNINCLHCGSDCHRDSNVKDMPYKDFIDVARRVATVYNPHMTMIVITGGEPLVRNDLEKCGKELYDLGFPWGMVTNGYIFTKERFFSLLDAGLRSVTISLDGFNESHNWLRGRNDSWERAMNAVRMVVKEKELVYDVVTCVNQKNICELERLRTHLIDEGVRKWRLFTIFPIGRASDNPLLDVTNEQFRWLMNFIKETREEGKIIASYGCEGFLGIYENKVRDGFFFCRAGINIASILADGSIGACPNINRAFIQGNIYKDDFLEVWNRKFELMRKREWTGTGICKDCNEFRWCKGNGMHLHEPGNKNVLRCHYRMLENK